MKEVNFSILGKEMSCNEKIVGVKLRTKWEWEKWRVDNVNYELRIFKI